MEYKVGDLVAHVGTPFVERRIRDIKDGKYLLWGFYEYVTEDKIVGVVVPS